VVTLGNFLLREEGQSLNSGGAEREGSQSLCCSTPERDLAILPFGRMFPVGAARRRLSHPPKELDKKDYFELLRNFKKRSGVFP
jgi:hypothetical protein